jgi:hypothetical protein
MLMWWIDSTFDLQRKEVRAQCYGLTIFDNVACSELETPPERIDNETNDNDGIDRGPVRFELSMPVSAAAHERLRQANGFQKEGKATRDISLHQRFQV